MSLPAQLSVAGGTARPHVILVVEDEVLVRGVAAEYLRDCGFSVIEAADASEALAVIATGELIDAVFSDVQMPGPIDGLQLASWIQKHRGLPVLLTSGSRDTMRDAGYADDAFVAKPYLLQEIARRLSVMLEAEADAAAPDGAAP